MALADVADDGCANLIQDGILRCRFRNGIEHEEMMTPGELQELDIDLWSTSCMLTPGHRLAVEVSSTNFNRYDRNLNTGEAFGRDAKPVIAEQTIYHDSRRASSIAVTIRA